MMIRLCIGLLIFTNVAAVPDYQCSAVIIGILLPPKVQRRSVQRCILFHRQTWISQQKLALTWRQTYVLFKQGWAQDDQEKIINQSSQRELWIIFFLVTLCSSLFERLNKQQSMTALSKQYLELWFACTRKFKLDIGILLLTYILDKRNTAK